MGLAGNHGASRWSGLDRSAGGVRGAAGAVRDFCARRRSEANRRRAGRWLGLGGESLGQPLIQLRLGSKLPSLRILLPPVGEGLSAPLLSPIDGGSIRRLSRRAAGLKLDAGYFPVNLDGGAAARALMVSSPANVLPNTSFFQKRITL